jgi:prepilin-type N-terminal cleavage/methylation domain-containing protein
MKKILYKSKKAFTLVELIVVITILVILFTIALVSFKNYTKDARDGNRVASISDI